MPIAFETGGLQQLDPSTWGNPATGDLVTLAYVDAVPDLPVPLEDIDALRRRLTELQSEFGCLIEAHVLTVAGQPALLRLEKFPLPDRPGLGFTAGIVLPKATCSAILKIMCRETGRSGVREAAVVPKVGFQNMFPAHPYAPEVKGKLPYNVADDAHWDPQFPDHPLSRARRWISHISRTAQVDPRFAALPPFTGPATVPEPADDPAEAVAPAVGHSTVDSPNTADAAEPAPMSTGDASAPVAPDADRPVPSSISRLPAAARQYAGSPIGATPNRVDRRSALLAKATGAGDPGSATTDVGARGSLSSPQSPMDATETAPIPTAMALGSAPREPAGETGRPADIGSRFLAAGSPSERGPWLPEDAPETTAMPAGSARLPSQDLESAAQRESAPGSDSSASSAETTAIPAGSASEGGARFPSDSAETTVFPAGPTFEDAAERASAAQTAAIPTGPIRGLAGRLSSDSPAPPGGSGPRSPANTEQSSEPDDPKSAAIPRVPDEPHSAAIPRVPSEAAETTAIPSGRGHAGRSLTGGSASVDAETVAGAETRPIPKH
ncbi:hypothetical protein [Nocardia thraciensis]